MKNQEVPSVLMPPDQILVRKKPAKVVYDFTKNSENQRLLREEKYEYFQADYRTDSILKDSDLKILEEELKRK